MDYRPILSTLFFAGGLLFFILAAADFWSPNRLEEGVPLDAITSVQDAEVDLQHLTSESLVADPATNLQDLDVLSLIFLPANYECEICSRRTTEFARAFDKHEAFEDLAAEASTVILESDVQTATHFARAQRFGIPSFQFSKVPAAVRDTTRGRCFALLVDPQTEEAFFEVHINKVRVTEESNAVFEAAREAYQKATQ